MPMRWNGTLRMTDLVFQEPTWIACSSRFLQHATVMPGSAWPRRKRSCSYMEEELARKTWRRAGCACGCCCRLPSLPKLQQAGIGLATTRPDRYAGQGGPDPCGGADTWFMASSRCRPVLEH